MKMIDVNIIIKNMWKIKTKDNLTKILNWLICGLIFLLPFQTRLLIRQGELGGNSWEYGVLGLYVVDFILALVVFVGLDYFLEFVFEKIKFKKAIWILVFFGLLVWVGLGMKWAGDFWLVFYWTLRFFLYFGFAVTVWSLKPKLKYIAASFIFAGLIQSILAIWQFVTQQVVASKWLGMAAHQAMDLGASVIEIGDERWLRAYGSFSHPNVLAGFLVIAILMTIYLASNYRNSLKIKNKVINPAIFNLVLPILLAGLTMTFCRSAVLSLAVALIFIFIFVLIKNKTELKDFIKPGLIVLVCAIGFGVVFSNFIVVRTNFDTRLEKQSISDRQIQFGASQEIISQDTLRGVGVGHFTETWHKLDSSLGYWQYQPMHNQYILVLAELGVIGLILLLALIVLRIISIDKFNRATIFKLSAFLAIIIIALFDHYWWTANFGQISWWLFLALL